MIKFVRIGSQLEDGKNQFAFYDTERSVFIGIEGVNIFDNWKMFEINFKSSGLPMRNDLLFYKSIMPPDMLPKEEKIEFKCKYCGKVVSDDDAICGLYDLNPYCSKKCLELNGQKDFLSNIKEDNNKKSSDDFILCPSCKRKLYKYRGTAKGGDIYHTILGNSGWSCNHCSHSFHLPMDYNYDEAWGALFNTYSLKLKLKPSEEILSSICLPSPLTEEYSLILIMNDKINAILNWLDKKFGDEE